MRYKEMKRNSKRRDRLALTPPLAWGELPDISGGQEVHHHFIALFHGKQFRNLYMLASACYLACGLPITFQSIFCWYSHSLQLWKSISTRRLSHWEAPGECERRQRVNLPVSMPDENETLGRHCGWAME
jgi:hypothetical protein